jgi:hypothetical protein
MKVKTYLLMELVEGRRVTNVLDLALATAALALGIVGLPMTTANPDVNWPLESVLPEACPYSSGIRKLAVRTSPSTRICSLVADLFCSLYLTHCISADLRKEEIDRRLLWRIAGRLGIKQVDLVACLTCLVAWLFKQVKCRHRNVQAN